MQISRHSPASRFITLFYAMYDPSIGLLRYVNAGQNPPLVRRVSGKFERLPATGVALGMFERSTFDEGQTTLCAGDQLVMYSDGITEAEDPSGQPLEETGLEQAIELYANSSAAALAAHILSVVEAHVRQSRFTDDLTVLILKKA